MGDLDPNLIGGPRGPTRDLNSNCIYIGSAVIAGLTTATGTSTDHSTQSATIDHVYVCSTGDAVK